MAHTVQETATERGELLRIALCPCPSTSSSEAMRDLRVWSMVRSCSSNCLIRLGRKRGTPGVDSREQGQGHAAGRLASPCPQPASPGTTLTADPAVPGEGHPCPHTDTQPPPAARDSGQGPCGTPACCPLGAPLTSLPPLPSPPSAPALPQGQPACGRPVNGSKGHMSAPCLP